LFFILFYFLFFAFVGVGGWL